MPLDKSHAVLSGHGTMATELNKLNVGDEVVLDFESLQWMGQGFAHQVFVVFQNQHPDIKLIPVNMSESVTKMYNHVTSE